MADGGITGTPVQTAAFGRFFKTPTSTGGGSPMASKTVTQRDTSGGGSRTQRKSSATVAKANAESQLNRLVNKSRGDSNYRNLNNVYTSNQVSNNNLINLNADQQAFVNRNRRKDGSFNSAAQAIINNSGKGFVVDNGKAVVDNVTAYQRDLQNFRTASPLNEQAYVNRFPKTAAFEKLLAKGAEGIIGTPARAIKAVTDTYLDGVQNMIEKISGTKAKNVEVAKDQDTNIDEIVNNLQRKVKENDEQIKETAVTRGNNMPGTFIPPEQRVPVDDILNADLLEVEEDSPLNIAPTEGIAQSEREQKELEGGTVTQGLTPIRLDRTLADDENLSLFDLSGSDEPGQVTAFDLDPYKEYFDLNKNERVSPIDVDIARGDVARQMFAPGFERDSSFEDFSQMLSDQTKARTEGFPDIDVTQEGDFLDRRNELTGTTDFTNRRDLLSNRDLVNNPIEGQATAAGKGLVYADGTPIMEPNPTPLFDSEIDEEAIRRAIEGKADGGQMFGNQNMSTFDKLKAIADGIADNK